MTTLWKPDPEVAAVTRHPSWGPFHRALGKAGVHVNNEERLPSGEWRVPYWVIIRSHALIDTGVPAGQPLYRQKIAEGFGPTLISALANGLPRQESQVLGRKRSLLCRLYLLDMLLPEIDNA